MIGSADILFVACNRLAFTRAAIETLIENTPPRLVDRLIIYDDGSTDGTREYLTSLNAPVRLQVRRTHLGSPVAVMNHYLTAEGGTNGPELFAKIDNDVIVPPGWLEQSLAVMNGSPDLDLLGIEPPDSRKPHPSAPLSVDRTREAELAPGPPRWVPADTIGGIGLMRRRCFFNRSKMQPHHTYGGFWDWQLRHPEFERGWIAPALNLFLLDRLPIEPWCSLSRFYCDRGWQRAWRGYTDADGHLWAWWHKEVFA